MKNSKTFLFAASALMCASAAAQLINMPTAAPEAPASAPASDAAPSPSSPSSTASLRAPSMGIFESSTGEKFSDKVFDVNSDSFDLENGTLKWKGKTFAIGDSRVVRARFERYLSSPVDKQNFQAYQTILNEIISQLAASNDRLTIDQLRVPWSRLFDAAEYEADGGSSITIANLVYLSWRMRDEFDSKKLGDMQKQMDVDKAKRILADRMQFLEYANDKIKSSVSARKAAKMERKQGTSEIAQRTQELSEQALALATAKTATSALGLKAVFQFQSNTIAFMMERKFQQAQISAMFYRHIYRGSAQDLQVGKENFQEFMDIKNFIPTMDMFEMMATDARKDVRDGMAAVGNMYDKGNKYSALQRLMETFVLGEHEPILQVFDENKKNVLWKIYKDTSTIKELADSKDWDGIEAILADIKKEASDFPEREILAKVKTAKRASDMNLMAAKQAAALGKINDVRKYMTQAMEIWPLNPAIETFNAELLGMATGMPKYIEKFDDLYKRGNYRDIVAEAPEYGLALKGDAARSAKLRATVVKLSQIDAMVAQAAEFIKQGNPYFSWDILENAVIIEPNDSELARARAQLAPEVADYVKIIDRARKAETAGEYAASLNFYLAAQDIFPASQICRKGIERVAPMYAK